jgi:threonine/homoserine/homoserine lactone efflux protein
VGSLWGFLLLAVVLSLTPGPDDVLVLRSSVRGGPRLGAATTLGIAVGTSVWGLAAAVGLAVAVERSESFYDGLRLAGAGYLVVLGAAPMVVRALGRVRSGVPRQVGGPDAPEGPDGTCPAFVAGLMSDVLNPKIGVFYLAVVPQFVPAGEPPLRWSLLFCAVDIGVATVWLLALTWLASAFVGWLRRPAVLRWSQRLLSGVLVCLGVAAALLP